MANLQTTCSGILAQTQQTEDFLLSLTVHGSHSEIAAHSHERPYLCLLAHGGYSEKSREVRAVQTGAVLFRQAGYEHSNRFESGESLCFNLEILSAEHLAILNQQRLPEQELEARGTTAIYRLLHSFRSGAAVDIVNLQCHEVVAEHLCLEDGHGDPAWVQQIQERICDDPQASISMGNLAHEHQLHPNYMIRRFKQSTGLTLSEYLIQKRLAHSMGALIKGFDPINKVALDAGFYDQSHYSRNFRKTFGTTPGRFQRRVQG